MKSIKFSVFFYDGKNIDTGEILSAQQAWADGLAEFTEDGLMTVDECVILRLHDQPQEVDKDHWQIGGQLHEDNALYYQEVGEGIKRFQR